VSEFMVGTRRSVVVLEGAGCFVLNGVCWNGGVFRILVRSPKYRSIARCDRMVCWEYDGHCYNFEGRYELGFFFGRRHVEFGD